MVATPKVIRTDISAHSSGFMIMVRNEANPNPYGGTEANDLIRNAVRDRDVSNEDWARIKALLTEHRSLDYAYDRAVEFGETAKRQLRLFVPSREREALMALADYVLLRDR